jgi:hypothetical protein
MWKILLGIASLAPNVEGTWKQRSITNLGSGVRAAIDANRIRGSTDVAFTASSSALAFVAHTSATESAVGFEAEFATLTPPSATADIFGDDVAFGGDHVTGKMMFINQGASALNQGQVVYFRGTFNSWSVHYSNHPNDV